MPRNGEPEVFTISAEMKGETEKGIRLFDGVKTDWFPKSQVEPHGDGTYTIPIWLLKDKGFV